MSLLSTKEVSELVGIPEATLRYWRHADLGPRSGKLGRRVVYRQEDVDAWITEQLETTARGGNPAA